MAVGAHISVLQLEEWRPATRHTKQCREHDFLEAYEA